ncbi:glycoside hydrolase family 71 [Diplodia corticola]|uniref:Glycoside hydrolase family 71 n=1 Tax=Diplodia corticola TaxID=236234 RepID=A0A1J9SE77_9PEZI|nr:glycoside hydrolase family 71 [Diplodia corticola]OJD38735.1 glycoside hydrolase family 71 [Diplodia corticola]
MRAQSLQYLATATLALLSASSAAANDERAVFAHYMVGVIHEDHVHQDVDDAVAMGLDGFALNIGDPSTQFTRDVFNNMFDYTRDNHPDFKLFISMDLWSQNDTLNFDGYFVDFLGHDAYYKGPNGYPFVSTYGNGNFSKEKWQTWRNRFSDKLYFVPDFAGMIGEGNQTAAWWDEWDGVIDGLFDWESAWPERGLSNTQSIAADVVQVDSTASQNKTYMIGMSMLQYKNSYGANIYRAGEENLSWRIHNILNMSATSPSSPTFAQLLTWNDGPESHYLGTIWPEMNNDTDPSRYATQSAAPHTAIQPLLSSFIAAFKSTLGPADMQPQGPAKDKPAIGALWYKSILASTACPDEHSGELHDAKPDGYAVAADVAAWAVVVADDADDAAELTLRGFSGGQQVGDVVDLVPGFNFGNFSALRAGKQCMEVRDKAGALVAVARGGGDVSGDCPDGIYNLNPQVVGLLDEELEEGGCVEDDGGDDDDDDGKDDDDSWGVRGVALDRVGLVAGVLVSVLWVSGLVGL